MREPDYTQTVWPTIEAKLGRKLTAEENYRFMYRGGGMFKEWFFNSLKECSTAEETEDLFARAIGPRVWHSPVEQPSLLKMVWELLWGKLKRKL